MSMGYGILHTLSVVGDDYKKFIEMIKTASITGGLDYKDVEKVKEEILRQKQKSEKDYTNLKLNPFGCMIYEVGAYKDGSNIVRTFKIFFQFPLPFETLKNETNSDFVFPIDVLMNCISLTLPTVKLMYQRNEALSSDRYNQFCIYDSRETDYDDDDISSVSTPRTSEASVKRSCELKLEQVEEEKQELVRKSERRERELIENFENERRGLLEKLEAKKKSKKELKEEFEKDKSKLIETYERSNKELVEKFEKEKRELVRKFASDKREMLSEFEEATKTVVEKLEGRKSEIIEDFEREKKELLEYIESEKREKNEVIEKLKRERRQGREFVEKLQRREIELEIQLKQAEITLQYITHSNEELK